MATTRRTTMRGRKVGSWLVKNKERRQQKKQRLTRFVRLGMKRRSRRVVETAWALFHIGEARGYVSE